MLEKGIKSRLRCIDPHFEWSWQLRRDCRTMETEGAVPSLLSPRHQNHAIVGTTAVVELPITGHPRLSILDTCHRKIRLLGEGPVAFLGGLVA